MLLASLITQFQAFAGMQWTATTTDPHSLHHHHHHHRYRHQYHGLMVRTCTAKTCRDVENKPLLMSAIDFKRHQHGPCSLDTLFIYTTVELLIS